MRSNTTMIVMRSLMAVLVLTLGVLALTRGSALLGGILVTLAVLRVAMLVAQHRRRERFRRRLAERRGSWPPAAPRPSGRSPRAGRSFDRHGTSGPSPD